MSPASGFTNSLAEHCQKSDQTPSIVSKSFQVQMAAKLQGLGSLDWALQISLGNQFVNFVVIVLARRITNILEEFTDEQQADKYSGFIV